MTSTWIKFGTAGAALLLSPLAASAADIRGGGPYYQAAPSHKAQPHRGQPSYSAQPSYKAAPGKGFVPSTIAYYNWTGFYVGAVGGYGWGRSHWDPVNVTMHPRGWHLGGTLGYNFQLANAVFGLETDLAWANAKGSTNILGATLTTQNNWLGTTRGRVGYAFDRFLPYLTGGVAYGSVKAEVAPFGLSERKTKFGWTLGAGLEYGFLGNWTAKAEYLYVDLGRFNTSFAPATRVNFKEHALRLGVNYRFGGPVYSRF